LSETFNYTVTDSSGGTDIATVTITITGANDAPVATNDVGAAVEDGASGSGNVLTNDTDVDAGATRTVMVIRTGGTEGSGTAGTVGSSLTGTYGSLTLNADGTYTYSVNNGNGAVQALAAGTTLTESFNYTVSDGSLTDIAVLTITITGTNDAPSASNDTGTAAEAGGVANGTAGSNATGNVLTNDSDVDSGDSRSVSDSGTRTGTYGVLTLNADGSYSYAVNDNAAAVQALRAGQTVTETFSYTLADSAGATSTATLTITLTGANDAPTAVNDTASATEDGGTVTGNVLSNDTDVDTGDTRAVSNPGTRTGGFGTLTLNADGSYSFAVNNASATVQALQAGQTLSETFSYTVIDSAGATSTATLTITLTGANDAPTVVGTTNSASTTAGQAVSFSVPASVFRDADSSDSLSLTASLADGSPLPAWLSFNSTTGAFTGTPPSDFSGTLSLIVRGADSQGAEATTTVALTVDAAPTTTVVTPLVPTTGTTTTGTTTTGTTTTGTTTTGTTTTGTVVTLISTGTAPTTSPLITGGTNTQGGTATSPNVAADPVTTFTAGVASSGGNNSGPGSAAAASAALLSGQRGDSISTSGLFQQVRTANVELFLTGAPARQVMLQNTETSVNVPRNIFRHSNPGENLNFEAKRPDGSPLPPWLKFDANNLTFSGTPPVGVVGVQDFIVVARDSNGNEVTAQVQINVARDVENIETRPQGQGAAPPASEAPDGTGAAPSAPGTPGSPENSDQSADGRRADVSPVLQNGFSNQIHAAGEGGLLSEARAFLAAFLGAGNVEKDAA